MCTANALVAPLLLMVLMGCSSREPTVEVRARWLVPEPARPRPGSVWAHVAVRRPDGGRDREQVFPYEGRDRFPLRELALGPERTLEVDFRDSDDPTSPRCCGGVSEPFDLTAGESTVVNLNLTVQPNLQVDQSLVSWIRWPEGRPDARELQSGLVIPAGPYFAVAPGDSLATEATVSSEAFRLVGDMTPTSLQVSDSDGALLAEAEPDANGDWPRVQLSLGDRDPSSVFVRAVLSEASARSEPVLLQNAWFVTSSASRTPTGESRLVETQSLDSFSSETDVLLPLRLAESPDGDAVVVINDLPWDQRGSPERRRDAMIAYDQARDVVVLFGGLVDDRILNDTWLWDGTAWSRVDPPQSPPGRWSGEAVYDAARQRVVLFGGAGGGVSLNDTWEWDGRSWTQRSPPVTPAARNSHGLAYHSTRGTVVLFGGTTISGRLNDTWEWDGETWIERQVDERPPARDSPGMAFDKARDEIVMFGGFDSRNRALGDTWVWDGTSWAERDPSLSPLPRFDGFIEYDSGRQRVVMFAGGDFSQPGPFADTWTWDGEAWTEIPTTVAPAARISHSLTFDAGRNRFLVFGGYGGSMVGTFDDTWAFEGSAWEELDLERTRPPRRIYPSLVFDQARGRTVLFGGISVPGNLPLGDTWEWDGETWVQLSETGPSPRIASMVYDPIREDVILHGGNVGRDTWRWNGELWTQVLTSTAPPTGGAMAFDPIRQQVLFYGGSVPGPGGFPSLLGQTWAFDGSDWSRLQPPATPPPRISHMMTTDTANGRVVLFGGFSAEGVLDETWSWDGMTWEQLQPAVSPPARANHSMLYDATRQRVVISSGNSGALLGDTWEFDGQTWVDATPDRSPVARFGAGAAYDSLRDVAILFGGSPSPQGQVALDDTWERPSMGSAKIIRFDGGPTPVEPVNATGLRVLARCAADPAGAFLEGWNGSSWEEISRNRASLDAEPGSWLMDTTIEEASLVRSYLSDGGPRFRCRARAESNSAGTALDYIEVRLRYRST